MGSSSGAQSFLPAPEAALLDELLHALGQPLTVLGTCRLLARGSDPPEGGLLAELADQVDRAREMYDALRLLVAHTGQRASVRALITDCEQELGERRVHVTVDEDGGTLDGRIVAGILRTALASSGPGEAPAVQVRGGWLETDGGGALNTSPVPWLLRVAEAVAEADGVAMVYKLQPFHARVRLHRA